MWTVIEYFVMLKFAVWLNLMLLFCSSTTHNEIFYSDVAYPVFPTKFVNYLQ